ncbi:MAG: cupin-like domain-containing protein [Bacteroidia bacterium]
MGRTLDIEVVHDISPEDFIKNYLKKSKPVLLKGAAKNWDACKHWNLDFFKASFGESTVQVAEGKKWVSSKKPGYAAKFEYREVSVAEYIDGIQADPPKTDYLRFYPFFDKHPQLIKDLGMSMIYPMSDMKNKNRVKGRLFIGPKGTSTPIHHAPVSNLFVEVSGRKKWEIISPVYTPFIYPVPTRTAYFAAKADFRDPLGPDFPLFKYCDKIVVTLEAGDILFTPRFWWHGVSNVDATIAVSLWWTTLWSIFNSFSIFPQNVLFLFGSPNPILYRIAKKLGIATDEDSIADKISNIQNEK